ncbi:hypothetical protein GPECTOR_172g199 [Gonium pectorale]|uniref:EF-hand domain-containing protein n=1 Tax=Gonium pectorale TaxID=33097 RepID=A0A150FXC2_GONPE|nr:hypothetical protein GPECTOR_172g199 [Gonium pectorale]|eukprot:KXZ42262.1 hypothetical protein GPECTOR_172g199 [Gonium pectorale]
MPPDEAAAPIPRGPDGGNKKLNVKDIIQQNLDRDGDGTIDTAELVTLLEGLAQSRKEKKYLCYAVLGMLIFGLALIGTIIGLTYAIMDNMKETEVGRGNTMYIKGSDSHLDIVRTGSAEFAVNDNGALVHRLHAEVMAAKGTPVNDTTPPPVLQTAE